MRRSEIVAAIRRDVGFMGPRAVRLDHAERQAPEDAKRAARATAATREDMRMAAARVRAKLDELEQLL